MSGEARIRLTRQFLGPAWLTTNGDSQLVGYSLDLVADAFIERIAEGLYAKLPDTAPPQALQAIGRDRRVIRGIYETGPQYIARLFNWISDRKRTGNPWALLQKLSEYCGPGFAFRTVDVNGNWWSRDVNGVESVLLAQANWNWDGDLSGLNWSRFWVIVYPNSSVWAAQLHNWGDATGPGWGANDATTWGSTATLEQVTTLRAIVKDWKPLHAICVNIIIALDSTSFSPTATTPDGTWLHWSKNVGGVQVSSRLSTARYWDGVS